MSASSEPCLEVTALPQLAPRRPEAHKGDFGRALLIGGSRGMTGAISLAGLACLRSGAGLVRLAVPSPCLDTVASFEPSYMTSPLPADSHGRLSLAAAEPLAELVEPATCVACGPGLGQSTELITLVGWLYESVAAPLVLDADGLNALAARPCSPAMHAGPRVLTPHPREFQRLLGEEAMAPADAERKAIAYARENQIVLVLKGHRTLVTDGRQFYRNTTGNPGMATGGSGDVLTGLITGLVGQQLTAWEAAVLGVYLHGLAGDRAAAELGQISLIARDLITYLPAAFRTITHA